MFTNVCDFYTFCKVYSKFLSKKSFKEFLIEIYINFCFFILLIFTFIFVFAFRNDKIFYIFCNRTL